MSFKSTRSALITGVITTSTDHTGAGLLMTHEASMIYNNMIHIFPLFFCPKLYTSWHYGWIFRVNNPKFEIRFAMLVDLTEFFSVGSAQESHGSYTGIDRRDVHKLRARSSLCLHGWSHSHSVIVTHCFCTAPLFSLCRQHWSPTHPQKCWCPFRRSPFICSLPPRDTNHPTGPLKRNCINKMHFITRSLSVYDFSLVLHDTSRREVANSAR